MMLATDSSASAALAGSKSCTLVITTYNRPKLLHWGLTQLRELIIPKGWQAEVLIVDNHPAGNAKPVFDEMQPGFPLPLRYVAEAKLGLSHARNRGIEESKAEYIAFLDDDAKLRPDWLLETAKVFDGQGADVVGGRILLWWEEVRMPEWFNGRHRALISENDRGVELKPVATRGAVICVFMVRRRVPEVIGGFRADLGRKGTSLGSGEETDWHARALAAGMKYFYCGKAVADHWVAANRITPEYLCGAAAGNAGSVLILDNKPRWWLALGLLRWSALAAALDLSLRIMQLVAPERSPGHRIDLKLRLAKYTGKLRGAWALLRGNMP